MATAAGRSVVDEMLDELLPEALEWERLVRTYPVPALLLAATGGFVLAYTRGPGIIAALSTLAASQLGDVVRDVVGERLR
jgi:hypothetical protein